MSAAFPIALFIVVATIWAAAVIVSWRLLALFLRRAGDDADIPAVLREPERHPEKLVFFFRRSTVPRLKAEPDLWRLRQVLAVLLVLGLVVPPVGFAGLFLVALNLAATPAH